MPLQRDESFFYLTLVRHGETESNKLHILQGQMDTLLSEHGKQQAHKLSSHLASYDISFDLVFSSDLTRAIETAQIIVDNLQDDREPRFTKDDLDTEKRSKIPKKCFTGQNDLFDGGQCSQIANDAASTATCNDGHDHSARETSCPLVRIDSRLRERSYGVLEGSTLKELHEAAKEAGLPEKSYTCLAPQGVESLEEVRQKIDDFFRNHLIHQVSQFTESLSGSDIPCGTGASLGETFRPPDHFQTQSANLKRVSVLVVTHGGVIREFMRLFRDEYDCRLEELEEPLQVTPNTGVNIFKVFLEKTPGNESHKITAVQLLIYNDLSHMRETPDERADRSTVDSSSSNFDKILGLVNALKMKRVNSSQVNPAVQQSQYEAL